MNRRPRPRNYCCGRKPVCRVEDASLDCCNDYPISSTTNYLSCAIIIILIVTICALALYLRQHYLDCKNGKSEEESNTEGKQGKGNMPSPEPNEPLDEQGEAEPEEESEAKPAAEAEFDPAEESEYES